LQAPDALILQNALGLAQLINNQVLINRYDLKISSSVLTLGQATLGQATSGQATSGQAPMLNFFNSFVF